MIPFLVVCDAFQSETVAFADLVLPDTTYLERHDVMSMLDRPICEFDGPVDSVRVPVLPPTGECKPFQEVLIELASRLKFPAFTTRRGQPQVQRLPRLRRQLPAAAGHRLPHGLARQGRQRAPARRAEPEAVGDVRARTTACSSTTCPRACTTCATGTAPTSTSPRTRAGARGTTRCSWRCTPTRCRASASRRRARPRAASRPEHLRERIDTYFDPLPFWYPPLEEARHRPERLSAERHHAAADGDVPLVGLAERLAAADPQPQLPARESGHRQGRGHRGRRLVLGRKPVGQGALHAALQRGGGAGHGVDLERDRQGRRRLAAGARRRRGAQGLPAEPPDQRGAAVAGGSG